MTINIADNAPRISYSVAEGVTQTSFAVPFEFFNASDIKLYVDTTLKTLVTNYTVSGGSGSTGTVTSSVTGIAGGSVVVITRDIALERTSDFPVAGSFNITSLNTELDRFVAIAADLKDNADRSLSAEDYDASVSLTIPTVVNRKGKTLAFNLTTGAVEAGPTIADTQSVADASADIALLADIQDGTVATNAITNVNTIRTDVSTVSGISGNVTTVAGNNANVSTVAGNIADVNTVAGIDSNVTTVAGISANVTAVAGNATNINTVAADGTDIGIVSTNIANVNTVAGINANVSTVAGISANVTAVAADATDIGIVSTNIANVNTAAGNTTNINAAVANATNINAVVADAVDIGTVASNIANVNIAAGNTTNINAAVANTTNINAVVADAADIGVVASNIANVNTVATNDANVTTVAGINANVTTVAGISANVTTVATNNANVTAVGTNIADVSLVAAEISNNNLQTIVADIAAVITVANDLTEATSEIDTVANSIANVDAVGGSIANVNTVAANLVNVNNFADTYAIAATAPAGATVGDLWFDTAAQAMKVYGSSGWQNAGSSVNGTAERVTYTATAAQTTFAATYDAGYVDVWLNGIKLTAGTDFTATNGTSIVLAVGAGAGDLLDIIGYGTFELANFAIGDANNVSTTGVTDGQVLAYNNATGIFEPSNGFDASTLATVATTGSFTDLINQPAPFDPSTLATVATTGAYSDLTGTPTGLATETFVGTAIANLVDTAPATLDTLNELAAALGDDPNFATTVTNSIATKLPLAGGTLTGGLNVTSGNVGIGTSSPSAKLDVNSGDIAISSTQASDNGDLGEFQFWNTTNAGSGSGSSFVNDVAAIQGQMQGTGNNSGGSLHFYTKADGGSKTERMAITGDGNVGIGIVPTLSSIGGNRRLLQVTNGASGGQIAMGNNSSESENPRIFSDADNLGFATATTGGGILQFYTNNTERMSISAAGVISGNGSGLTGISPPTTYGAVGTYTRLCIVQTGTRTFIAASTSYSAASLKKPTAGSNTAHNLTFVNKLITNEASGLSGTWRTMHDIIIEDSVNQLTSVLVVRIS